MSDQSRFIEEIATAKIEGYGQAEFPTDLDETIGKLIEIYLGSSEAERKHILSSLSHEHARRLLAYAERMATQAIRSRSREKLVFGLTALVLEGFRLDPRESLMRMALHYDAAVRLDVDARDLFTEVASTTTSEVSDALKRFPDRKPEDRSISAMGYSLIATPAGPAYQRGW